MNPFDPSVIATRRLVLTPLRPADADAMATVLGDERLHEFIGGHPASVADLRRRYVRLAAGSGDPDELWLNWIVRQRPDPVPPDDAGVPVGAEVGGVQVGGVSVGTEVGGVSVGTESDGVPVGAEFVGVPMGTEFDGVSVGTVQATVTRLGDGWTAAVAWVIGVPWQGRGFAVEAARALVSWLRGQGVGVVTAAVHPDHHASAAVAARAGLTVTDEVIDGERVWRAGPGP